MNFIKKVISKSENGVSKNLFRKNLYRYRGDSQ